MLYADVKKGDLIPVVEAIIPSNSSIENPYCKSEFGYSSLLSEHSRNYFSRPGLRGFRINQSMENRNSSWSTMFRLTDDPNVTVDSLVFHAVDYDAGLRLTTEIESLHGGSLRMRHILRNIGSGTYILQGLEVTIPLSDAQTEILNFTGFHGSERIPQKQNLLDGVLLRELLWGKTGFDGPEMIAGSCGFNFNLGRLTMVHSAWSGNNLVYAQRGPKAFATISAGELLLPGEVELEHDDEYKTPWVVVTASNQGLNGLSDSLHLWQRSLSRHPRQQSVTLNVWEAVGFQQDFSKLALIARRARNIGVERYVLDDGWFHLRRDDRGGLGDWWVDKDVWPDGLSPLIQLVHGLGMSFGLWIEPEMINPCSDTFREHPDWIMSSGKRFPELERNQFVLDLSNNDAFDYIHKALHLLLSENAIDYIKWDHNRFLLEAGAPSHHWSPSVHAQTVAYYALLKQLESEFPNIEWESCASGGGRVDLENIKYVNRFWASDMTDALSRQRIQEWLVQSVAPEYLGAHVSQAVSQQTGRTLDLDFRAATAVFFSFGLELDLSRVNETEMIRLSEWVSWYKQERRFLHSQRFVRLDLPVDCAKSFGVISRDCKRAIIEYAQCEQPNSLRGIRLKIPYLNENANYSISLVGPNAESMANEQGNNFFGHGQVMSGSLLWEEGLWINSLRPETAILIEFKELE